MEGDEYDKNDNRKIRRVMYSKSHRKHYEITIKNDTLSNSLINSTAVLKEYEIIETLEFDSNRKRMSVIVRDLETQQFILFCKGADSAIFDKSICETSNLYDKCLREFAEKGWRTIVFSFKLLTYEECENYRQMIDEANNDILNRELMLEKVYDKIESNMTIIGVTAVEDKLQESVEQTLTCLREAGIKIWVLTGDKLETAINISESCKHFTSEMTKYILKGLKSKQEVTKKLATILNM